MLKEQLKDLKCVETIYDEEYSKIFKLTDGRLLKVISPMLLECFDAYNIDFESKILSTLAKGVPEIVSPISAVYNYNTCCAFTMEQVNGISLNEYDRNYTLYQKSNLYELFEIYSKLENVVKRSNDHGIVIPDLCTCDNIILLKDGSIKLIDYDGLQVGEEDVTVTMSTSLGDEIKYLFSPKYCKIPYHFTSELDKTSLTILMFLWIFNMDLTRVGHINPTTGKVITVQDIFRGLGIFDEEFMNKVEANISLTQRGSYLAKDLYRIVNNYNMIIYNTDSGRQAKKLLHK